MKPKKSRPQLPLPYLIPADFRLPESLLNQAMLRVAILLNRGICNEFYWVCNHINVEGKVDVSFDAAQLAIHKHEDVGRVRLVKRTKTESKFCEQAESYYDEEIDTYHVVPNDLLFKWWEEQETGDANAKSGDKATEVMPAKHRTGRPRKGESSKESLVISALAKHHRYQPGGTIENWIPAKTTQLAELASCKSVKVSVATVSRFFKRKFPNHASGYNGYVSACNRDARANIGALLMWFQGEVPESISNLLPHDSGSEDDE